MALFYTYGALAWRQTVPGFMSKVSASPTLPVDLVFQLLADVTQRGLSRVRDLPIVRAQED